MRWPQSSQGLRLSRRWQGCSGPRLKALTLTPQGFLMPAKNLSFKTDLAGVSGPQPDNGEDCSVRNEPQNLMKWPTTLLANLRYFN
ncbi:hypothetical protein GCM10009085_47950 [Pseudomonas avellanae]|nr:hypothetical protein GCM10009085_47950 [Pseudomonas avellanae]